MPEYQPRRRPPLWHRLGPAERALGLVIMIVAIGGLLLIADGLYIKARATDALPSSVAPCLPPADAWSNASYGCCPETTAPAITFSRLPLAKSVSPPR